MRIGAHVSSAGGPAGVFERGAKIGAEALQIFLSAPQQWRSPAFKDEQVTAFKAAFAEANIPVFAHGVYLMNFGSQDEALCGRSVTSLAAGLRWADELSLSGTIFHAGSHLGAGFDDVLPAVCRLLRQALDEAPGRSLLVIENSAGQGNCIGRSFAEMGAIIRGLDSDPRVAVCIDTCHALAMGYDITTREGVEIAMTEFEREIGFERLVAVHANDSKMPLGGVRDRHENIGDGYIGTAGFREILAHPAFADVPFLLEVPGLDGKGPDAENVSRLKRIRDAESVESAAPSGG
jgi:deoxyribonuclease-4